MIRLVTIASTALLVGVLAFAWRARSSAAQGVNPLTTLVRDGAQRSSVRGRVEQRLPAGGYTYLALRATDGSLIWTVTLGRGAALGERVSVRSLGEKTDFYSRRLQRTFPSLLFAIVSREN